MKISESALNIQATISAGLGNISAEAHTAKL